MADLVGIANIDPKWKRVGKKLYDKDGHLVYEGETVHDKPYGKGTVYFPDGKIYQDGYFAEKGLVEGKEYYKDGGLKVEAKFFCNTSAYGPNYPTEGDFYNREGVKVYSGRFSIVDGTVGRGWVKKPEGYENLETKYWPVKYFDAGDIFDMEHPYLDESFTCPVCGHITRKRKGRPERCENCAWLRDANAEKDPTLAGGPNIFSLAEYKAIWFNPHLTLQEYRVIVKRIFTASVDEKENSAKLEKFFTDPKILDYVDSDYMEHRDGKGYKHLLFAADNLVGLLFFWEW